MATKVLQMQNRTQTKKPASRKNKTHNKVSGKSKNKSTALAVRRPTGVSAATAQKFIQQGMRMGRIQANASTPVKKRTNKAVKRRANGGGSFFSRIFGGGAATLRSNPSMRKFGASAKIAGLGLLGGGASRLTAAAVLAVGDRFAPSWTESKWASPIVTFLAALFLVPRVVGYVGFKDAASQDIVTTGGVLFAAAEGLNILTNGDKVAEWSSSLRAALGKRIGAGSAGGTATNPTTVAAAAATAARDAATQGAIQAGASPTVANQVGAVAAQSTLQGLRGLDNVPASPFNNVRRMNSYSPRW